LRIKHNGFNLKKLSPKLNSTVSAIILLFAVDCTILIKSVKHYIMYIMLWPKQLIGGQKLTLLYNDFNVENRNYIMQDILALEMYK
jgi:hypothetical protein